MMIEEEFSVYFKDSMVGIYYVFEDGSGEYCTGDYAFLGLENEEIPQVIRHSTKSNKKMVFFKRLMADSNRVSGTRKVVYRQGDVSMVRCPEEVDKFYVYRRSAEKGDPDYSEKDHSAPHCEGQGPIEGMKEWASWYCFNKMDDGTFVAELDEAWWWGGGHNDGGTIRTKVPEEWMDLPYDEFLENVVTLSAARHYGFTAEDLKEKAGLREFFGF